MTTVIAMLRGVNVGGRTRLKMSELTEAYKSLNLEDVRTYVQSGNVVFSYSGQLSGLSERIERGLKDSLGLDVRVFIRTPKEYEKIVAGNPFIKNDQSRLHVTFLYARPVTIATGKIDAVKAEGEEFRLSGKEVYLFLPNGMGRTKLSNNFLERALNVPATTRNWNTVTALAEMAGPTSR